MQIFLALAFVIGLMLLAAWLLKRVGPIGNAQKVPVKVVGGVNIGNRERIIVVEVADQWLVLGVTAQQINTLSTMQKQDSASVETATNTKENQFSDWLKKMLEKRNTTQQ